MENYHYAFMHVSLMKINKIKLGDLAAKMLFLIAKFAKKFID